MALESMCSKLRNASVALVKFFIQHSLRGMDFVVVFLGTSASIPTKESNLPSVAIARWGEVYIFDVGEGTQRQLMSAKISLMKIKHIFITHLHADHILGLPGLLHTMCLMQRREKIVIHGPVGIKEYVEKTLEREEVVPPYPIEVREIKVGDFLILDERDFMVKATYGVHMVPNVMYALEEKERRKFNVELAKRMRIPRALWSRLQNGESVVVEGKEISPDDVLEESISGRKVVYTGDTTYCGQLVEMSKNADMLIHEATYSKEHHTKALMWLHSTGEMAGAVARDANVNTLVLTHFSPRITQRSILVNEARTMFRGNVLAAYDFMRVEITPNHEVREVVKNDDSRREGKSFDTSNNNEHKGM